MSGHRAGRNRAGWAAPGLAMALAVLLLGGCGLLGDREPEAVPTNTPRAVVRVIPTWTPIMTATPEPTATPDVVDVSGCALGAVYVRDVTIPDGTRLAPGGAVRQDLGDPQHGLLRLGSGVLARLCG